MNALVTPARPQTVAARPAPVAAGVRFELVKLLASWRARVLLIVCWLAPAVITGVVGRQSLLPSDTVFGRWMNATGWSGGLVVLAFGCEWALPLLTSLFAGDVFAVEDRLGTWRHLMIAVRSPRRIFAAKALASTVVIVIMVTGLAVSGVVGGLLAVGNRPLVGLSGQTLPPDEVAGRYLLAWLCVLAPTAAFAAVGLLGSVALGRSPMGLAVPALLAVLVAVLQLLPIPLAVRLALPSGAFVAWRGLFTAPVQTGPLVTGVLVALAWALAATVAAYLIFVRRNFADLAHDGSGRRFVIAGLLPLAAVSAVAALVISWIAPSGSGISQAKLERSLATAYGHLYRLQTDELHRPAVTEAQLQTTATCDKGGSLVADEGAGNDWRCVVSWRLPGATAVGSAIYQLDVTADGRYKADGDGPTEVNGFFLVRAPYGDAPNPLWQFDGSVDLLGGS
ncbi:ABC-2 type transport system permease protein [Friedmanniella endophytica]|uniref:ABC-2 type transport system permease protein n=1 Tax=Microlunatus kandeliicorticis TaxID=1759536 RepID=A0A7W3IT52_9ACTN|nr:ABC transporter permease [Microlunatus kandeliicorticis]MBA8794771.1 ABC-2 type transport system permease protein [Microlunatus kandeliicorticis]